MHRCMALPSPRQIPQQTQFADSISTSVSPEIWMKAVMKGYGLSSRNITGSIISLWSCIWNNHT